MLASVDMRVAELLPSTKARLEGPLRYLRTTPKQNHYAWRAGQLEILSCDQAGGTWNVQLLCTGIPSSKIFIFVGHKCIHHVYHNETSGDLKQYTSPLTLRFNTAIETDKETNLLWTTLVPVQLSMRP